jgi:hypothetical protein
MHKEYTMRALQHRLSALVVFGLLQASVSIPAHCQEDKAMMEALLRPTGWRAEWTGPGGSGITEVLFVRQGEKLIAKIRLVLPFEMTCEHPVEVGPSTVKFDGCRDPGLLLKFDPKDQDTPFRGTTPRGYEWKFRVK